MNCCTCLAFLLLIVAHGAPRPTVLWHGMGDVCCNPLSMGFIKDLIQQAIPGTYVYSVELGGSVFSDELGGFFGEVNSQVAEVCATLKADPNLSGGFNAVGFSQGGQFLRAYVQRCNDPPVYNLITMGGQHQGVADLPACTSVNDSICETVESLLALGAYNPYVQEILVQAQYFHDPMTPSEYLQYNKFLTDINNDVVVNATYKKNLISLNNLVLVMFSEDITVVPKETSWFGFYPDNNLNILLPYNQTALYTHDQIGLQELDQGGRLQFDTCPGGHMHITADWFTSHVIAPYLKN